MSSLDWSAGPISQGFTQNMSYHGLLEREQTTRNTGIDLGEDDRLNGELYLQAHAFLTEEI